jgi:hypothetical protein
MLMGMDERPRYSIRPGAVGLTRRQWIAGGALFVGGVITGIVLIATVSVAAGSIALSLTSLGCILINAFGRRPGA